MASKKKPNRPRPPAGARPSGARPGAPRPAAQGATGPRAANPRPAGPRPAREKSGPTRAERLAAAEAARRRRAARNNALIAAVVVLLVGGFVFKVVSNRRHRQETVKQLEAGGSCTADTKFDTDGGTGQNHVNGDLTYTVDPPAGGNHSPAPASAGQYTVETKPPDGQLVHSLEHGYVIVWYRPGGPGQTLDELKSLTGKYASDVLLVPRPSLPQPVAATAWHQRLLCSKSDPKALETFVTTFKNQGPEKIPH